MLCYQLVHGVLSFKEALYQRKLSNDLAHKCGLNVFAYDVQGQGGESVGLKEGQMAGFDEDIADLEIVIEFLEKLGFEVYLICGHSRGMFRDIQDK